MINEKRSPDNTSGSGCSYFPGGIYEYEKNIMVPEEWTNNRILLEFEGVYRNSRVYINGFEAGGAAYGYIPFYVSCEQYFNYGEINNIKVIADNSETPNSRWYSGGGIYRPVWLHIGKKSHIKIEGVKITTISYAPARIKIETSHFGGEVSGIQIFYNGHQAASAEGDSYEIEIPEAKLWDVVTPNLYTCRVSLSEDGQVVDQTIVTFGIRKIEWSNKGLFINGNNTLLRGGCLHHDNGILGACSYLESEYRRIKILKNAGYNAIRVSHNPAGRSLLQACDEIGMYVIDEAWDMWYNRKTKHDYALKFEECYESDLRSLVDRDFNHPSVIMYSIGNEVNEPATSQGIERERNMVNILHSLDNSRAVTAGINLMLVNMASKGKGVFDPDGKDKKNSLPVGSTLFNLIASFIGTGMNKAANSKKADKATSPCLDLLDIAGYNYSSGRYPKEGSAHPERVLYGSETFPQDLAKNWKAVKKYPYLIGDFMWTAWDYLGEAGIGTWAYSPDGKKFNKPYPWLLADTGAFDILGNETAEAGYASVVWGIRKEPYLGVQPVNKHGIKPVKSVWRGTNAIPSWSWSGCEGNKATIEIYSNAYSVELFLNGKSLGRKKLKLYKAIFKTSYSPGALEVVAYNTDGAETGRTNLVSAVGKINIRLTVEEKTVSDGEISYIDVSLNGENGEVESNSDSALTVEVENGELLAFGSANPRTDEAFQSGTYTTYYGKAQIVVRKSSEKQIMVTVYGSHLTPAIIYID